VTAASRCLDEGTAAAFAEGRLAAAALAEIEAHTATCALCRSLIVAALKAATRGGAALSTASGTTVVPAAPPPPAAGLPRGTSLGRYVILGLTGKGGMGDVYAAYDSELDRRVALKLLRARSGPDQAVFEGRLRREARALAKVSHRNVVAVHDVGTFEGRVFIAMEFVEGVTLKEWLATPRPRAEIIEKFVMAGRGLAAAHAAGLVHRDFKPQNVMIAADGTARVMDFGLVSVLGDAGADVADRAPLTAGADADVHLTQTGELLGTPLYMAPEQLLAKPAGPEADQFGFCVALHLALYGVAPFDDTSLRALIASVVAGRRRPPPAAAAVPGWLRNVIARGLSVDPAARWPSMGDLLAALQRDPARARRQRALVAGGAILAALSVSALARHALRPTTLCQGGPAALAGAWASPARREAVRAAFAGSGAPSVGEVWERVSAGLDRYAAAWLATYRDACEATHVRHEQPAAALELRMACLGERRTALAALTDVLVKVDRDSMENAVGAVNALPTLDRCSDVKQLQEAIEPPRDEATRGRVQRVRHELAVAKALADAGKNDEAYQRAVALVAEARRLDYAPLVAESLATLSHTHAHFTLQPADQPAREEAVWRGIAVNRFDLAAEAAVLIYTVLGTAPEDRERARLWEGVASAVIDRLGPSAERQRSWMLQGRAMRRLGEGDYAAALEAVRGAVALKRKISRPDDPDIAVSLNTEADVLQALGRTEEALGVNRRAYAGIVRAYGEGSQEAAFVLGNQGEYLIALGRAAEALRPLRDCLANLERHLPPDAQALAYPLTALGRTELALGHAAEAERLLARALRIRQASEPDQKLVGETRDALARARRVLQGP
jgi:tetratricopeptide (TPR) repeat protein